jgi:hypothetical protein
MGALELPGECVDPAAEGRVGAVRRRFPESIEYRRRNKCAAFAVTDPVRSSVNRKPELPRDID